MRCGRGGGARVARDAAWGRRAVTFAEARGTAEAPADAAATAAMKPAQALAYAQSNAQYKSHLREGATSHIYSCKAVADLGNGWWTVQDVKADGALGESRDINLAVVRWVKAKPAPAAAATK